MSASRYDDLHGNVPVKKNKYNQKAAVRKKVSERITQKGPKSFDFSPFLIQYEDYKDLICFSQLALTSLTFSSAGFNSRVLSNEATASLNSFLAFAISAL